MQSDRLLDSLPVWVVRFDADLTVRYVNAPIISALGRPAVELVGRPVAELGLDPTRYGHWLDAARTAIGRNEPGEYTPPGSTVRFWFTPQADPRGLLATIDPGRPADLGVVELYCRLMNHVPFAAWLRDETGHYLFVNPVYRAMVGANVEWVGRPLTAVWPTEIAEQFAASDRKVIDGGQPVETLDTAPVEGGDVRTWHNVKFPLTDAAGRRYVAGIALDVTDRLKMEDERRRLERQLLHAQKLESLGVMAGGMAHDFNNLLTTILGNASLARMNVSDPSPVSECLRKVEAAAVRAADLCQQMLAYSGRGQLADKDVDLNALVRDLSPVLGSVLAKETAVDLQLGGGMPAVRGDAGQLRQAVLNLVTNASDALNGARGTITVRTGVTTLTAESLGEWPTAPHLTAGRYVTLEVADTGAGMDEGTRTRIFEPFFTTKFVGRGLGLSAVQGIVQRHRGAIRVASQVGQGSTFTVLLPVSLGSGVVKYPGAERSARGRTVLVIDDEDDVRLVTRRLLEAGGFNVLLAVDGTDGVSTFANFHKQIAVVVLDLTMPRMGGADAFRELKRIDPNARVILTSGYGRQLALDTFDWKGLSAFLRKPFTSEELLSIVYQTIGN